MKLMTAVGEPPPPPPPPPVACWDATMPGIMSGPLRGGRANAARRLDRDGQVSEVIREVEVVEPLRDHAERVAAQPHRAHLAEAAGLVLRAHKGSVALDGHFLRVVDLDQVEVAGERRRREAGGVQFGGANG